MSITHLDSYWSFYNDTWGILSGHQLISALCVSYTVQVDCRELKGSTNHSLIPTDPFICPESGHVMFSDLFFRSFVEVIKLYQFLYRPKCQTQFLVII